MCPRIHWNSWYCLIFNTCGEKVAILNALWTTSTLWTVHIGGHHWSSFWFSNKQHYLSLVVWCSKTWLNQTKRTSGTLPWSCFVSYKKFPCFSSIVLPGCLPLLAFSWYELLPDSLIQTTNVIPKFNLWNRLLIYKLLMSIKIEIRGPSLAPRCLYPRKESFVYFSKSHRDSTIALRVEILSL